MTKNRFLLFLVSILLTCTFVVVQADTYAYGDVIVLTMAGDGYDDATEAEAFAEVLSIFKSRFGSMEQIKPGQSGQTGRLLMELEEEVVEDELVDADTEDIHEQDQRGLYTSCPTSCASNWTKQCKYYCASKTGRRRLGSSNGNGNNAGTYNFDRETCEDKMNIALNKYRNSKVKIAATLTPGS